MSSVASEMPVATETVGRRSGSARCLRAESLAEGVVLLLSLTVVQRLIGFVRGILFCRWMTPDELGRWDLAFGFLLLAAPLAVLGLPGSFGRYVEHYRRNGQLRMFLRRTTVLSAVLALSGAALILLCRDWVSWFLFGDVSFGNLATLSAFGLITVVTFNFLISLFSSLRQMRVVSLMQFSNSVAFAGIGLALLGFWQPSATSVVVGYTAACLLTSVGIIHFLRRVWRETPPADCDVPHRRFWAKLLPFAAWLWLADLLSNLFILADRYMIVHFGGFSAVDASVMVGNYHSSRVIPVLLLGVAEMLSAMLLPHLSHDWEAGRQSAVSDRLNLVVKVLGLTLTAGAVVILVASPLLFGWVLHGKYDGGLAVLPWSLMYSIWFSMCLLTQNYLWCAERARLVSLVHAVGLVANIGLNLLLLPLLGLLGAVIATASAVATSLLLVTLLSRRMGMRWDRGTGLVALLPLTLCCGPWFAAAAVVAFGSLTLYGQWFLSAGEKRQLTEATRHCLRRTGLVAPAVGSSNC